MTLYEFLISPQADCLLDKPSKRVQTIEQAIQNALKSCRKNTDATEKNYGQE